MFGKLLQLTKFSQPVLKKSQLLQICCHDVNINKNYAQEAHANETANHEENAESKVKHVNPFSSATAQQTSLGYEEDGEKRLKVLHLELDIANQEGRKVPSLDFVKPQHWQYILALSSKSARNKYYAYLWQVEKKIESKQRRKQERLVAVLEEKERLRQQRDECDHIIYGLGHTSLFLRIYDSTINHWQNNRLTRAMQFAPKVVLDCGYDQYMIKREAQNAAKQLMLSFALNRMHDEPLDLHFCNVDLNSICMQSLQRYIPTMFDPEFPMNVHQKCFTEVFPKQDLVYLTPHCRTDLNHFNPDDVYIIGAMVDTVNNEPLSLARAKRLGIRMARLPLDQHLQWGPGSGKSLTVNQMVDILLDLNHTGDWTKALSHVPRRKILDEEVANSREKSRMQKSRLQLDKILDFQHNRIDKRAGNSVTVNSDELPAQERKVRSYKDTQQFNLDTWATKKRN